MQQHGELLLPPHLPHGGGEDHAEDMDGGETDAPLAANGDPLGQLPDEGVRRHQEPVHAVREHRDQQHTDLFRHRVSRNQPGDSPSAEALGAGRRGLAADAGRHGPRAGQPLAGEAAKRHRQPVQHGRRPRYGGHRRPRRRAVAPEHVPRTAERQGKRDRGPVRPLCRHL